MADPTPAPGWFITTSHALQAWKRAMDGMLDGNTQSVREAFTPDAIWYDPFVGTVRGNRTIAEVLGTLKTQSFEHSTITVHNLIASDSSGAVEWQQMLETGRQSLTLEGSSWITAVDGRISRLWDYIQPLNNRKP